MGIFIARYPEPAQFRPPNLAHFFHRRPLALEEIEGEIGEASEDVTLICELKDAPGSGEPVRLSHALLCFLNMSRAINYLRLEVLYSFPKDEDSKSLVVIDYDDLLQEAFEASKRFRIWFGLSEPSEVHDVGFKIVDYLLSVMNGATQMLYPYHPHHPEDESIKVSRVLPDEVEIEGRRYFVSTNWTFILQPVGAQKVEAIMENIRVVLVPEDNLGEKMPISEMTVAKGEDGKPELSVRVLVRKVVPNIAPLYIQSLEDALAERIPGVKWARADFSANYDFHNLFAEIRADIFASDGDLPPLYGVEPDLKFPAPAKREHAAELPLLFRVMQEASLNLSAYLD